MPMTARPLGAAAAAAAIAALGLGATQASALTVSHTIPVGAYPSGVAFTAGGAKAYVTNESDKTISVIDTDGPSVTRTVSLGTLAPGAIGTGGARAVIAGVAGTPLWGAQVFDTGSDAATGAITALTSQGNSVSVTPDGQTAFIPTDRYITALDTSTRAPTLSPQGAYGYTHAALTPDGSELWATSYSDGKVHVFDADDITAAPTSFFVLLDAFGITVSPDGGTAYVTNGNRGVFPIDTATRTVAPLIAVDGFAYGVAVEPTGKVVFVTRYMDGKVSAIDATTREVIAEVVVGSSPTAIKASPRGGSVYVINQMSNSVSVISFGLPGAPAAPSASAGADTATVTWAPPASDGGFPLTYTVQAVEDPSKTCSAGGAATSCEITGLTGGRQYTFTVTARNAMGGTTSAASAPVTPTAVPVPATAATPAAASTAAAPGQPALAVSVTASRRRLVNGQSVRLVVRSRNAGTAPAESTTACIRLPRGLVVANTHGAARTGSSLCFALGTVGAGEQAIRTVTARATASRGERARVAAVVQAQGVARSWATPATLRITPRTARPAVAG